MASLTEKFAANFQETVRLAGTRLGTDVSVRLLQGSPEAVHGEWTAGTEGGDVGWEVTAHELRPHCSCQTFAKGRLCQHLWALLVQAQNQGDLGQALKHSVRQKITLARAAAAEVTGGEVKYEYEKRRGGKAPGDLREIRIDDENSCTPGKPRPVRANPAGLCVDENLRDCRLLYVLRLEEQDVSGQRMHIELWWRQEGQDKRCQAVAPEELCALPREDDVRILRRLLPLASLYDKHDGGLRSNGLSVPVSVFRSAREELAVSEGLRWLSNSETPRRFHAFRLNPWLSGVFALQGEMLADGDCVIRGGLLRGGEFVPGGDVVWQSRGGWAIAGGEMFAVNWSEAEDLASNLLGTAGQGSQGELRFVSTDSARQWVRLVMEGTNLPLTGLPEPLLPPRRELPVHGVLYIRAAEFKRGGKEQLHVELMFDYGGVRCAENAVLQRLSLPDGTLVPRDAEAERRLRDRLKELSFVPLSASAGGGWELLPAKLDEAVRILVLEDWLVTAQGKSYVKPQERKLQVRKSGTDWFEVEGAVAFGNQELSLPVLLRALRRGESAVRLDDGTWGILPLDWLQHYTALTEFGTEHDGKLVFRVQQAALLEALLADRATDVDEELARAAAGLRLFAQPRPASAPVGFQAVLRPYQQDGLGWLLAMGRAGLGVCLADDMGLGKTVQVLALLRQRQLEGAGGPSLVVMPKSLLGNWAAEAARFAPSLCCQFYVGAGRSLDDMAAADVVFTTYGTMRLDAEALSAVEFDYCILDESQAIKNAESSTAKAARTLRARHRLVMTGTPVENNLLELLSQLQFLNPGIFGQGRVAELGAGLEEAQLRRLRQLVRPLLLRRRKEDVAKDLPPRTEQTIFCEMGDRQKALYEELRDYYRQKFQEEGMEANKMEALAALLRLRQAACHPLLVNETLTWVESAKFDVLLAQLESILDGGHKALVFSQFTKLLHLLEPELRTRNWQFCYLDGQTADRQAVVADFQNNPDKRLFLISLKAGGTGLNLTAADYVFLLDPWWNPAVEAQAVDRAYRIGQTRPVFAYRLLTVGTVEEKVAKLQQSKRRLAEAILDAVPQSGEQISREDLESLLVE